MRENNFEKGVRERLQDWQLSPSGKIWTEVEDAIRRRRRRRMIAIFIPAAALLLLGAGYALFFNHPVAENTLVQQPANGGSNTDPANYQPDSITGGTQSGNEQLTASTVAGQRAATASAQKAEHGSPVTKEAAASSPGHPINTAVKEDQVTIAPRSLPGNNSTAAEAPTQQHALSGSGTLQQQERLALRTTTENNNQPNRSNGLQPQLQQGLEDGIVSGTADQQRNRIDDLQHQRSVFKEPVPLISIAAADPVTALHSMLRPDITDITPPATADFHAIAMLHRFRWGASAGLGSSTYYNGNAGGFAKSADMLNASPAFSNYVAAPSSFPTAAVSSTPGLSYNAGVFASYAFGRRFAVEAGVAYLYNSERLNVGQQQAASSNALSLNASADRALYRGNNVQAFTNRYHFIELPVQLRYNAWKIGQGRLQINAGAAFGRMINSHAVTYEKTSNGYYSLNSSKLNPNQTSLLAGIRYYRSLPKGTAFSIGPEFRLGLTDMRPGTEDKNRYLQYGGVQLHFFLK